ncbi:hypothetical protein ABIA31_007258 [Catenulispora sp. MAP5-51]|uniref:hypothetical protein n=1 Tax=Catenulispora sp. MAP5-51 TaxID=3156298 RepID=UPI0035188C84
MAGLSRGCTSVGKDILTRLIAAARVNEAVAWSDAATHAEQEVAALWSDRAHADRAAPVEVTTEVLYQLAAAADAAISARHASGSEWALQVGLDLVEIRGLIAAAAVRAAAAGAGGRAE